MRPFLRIKAATFGLLLVAACTSPTDSGGPAPSLGRVGGGAPTREPSYVRVQATGKVVRITNLTGERIGYTVLEANVVFIAIMPPCSSPGSCPTLGPRATVEVPYEQITGYHEGATEAIVSAWNYVPDPQDGTRVGRMTQIRVRL